MNYNENDEVFSPNGDFLGIYLNNLSDFGMTKEEEQKFKQSLIEAGPTERLHNKFNELSALTIYGHRKVYAKGIGSKEQCLVLAPGNNDLAWINYKPEHYVSKKIVKLDPHNHIVNKNEFKEDKKLNQDNQIKSKVKNRI